MSQEHLAVDAAIDRTYIGGIERQEFNPTVDVLDRLARALAVDIVDLLAPLDPEIEEPAPLKRGPRPR